ncbi:acylphosphatase [Ferdinandcohnia sp. Marseille-Q9671]
MNALKRLRDDYVIRHANRIKLPEFPSSIVVRKKVIFSGRVQKVGFRLELFTIAQRLNVTGWVKNLEDGSVEAELQGEESKVDFLIKSMRSLKRASVKSVIVSIFLLVRKEEILQ